MDIKFYYNQSDDRQINKTLVEEKVLNGTIRENVDIMHPVVRFFSPEILRYNYCYIPDFRRYYFITSINAVSNEIYDVQFTTDVLMSFRGEILQYPVIVDKQTQESNGDEYIDDSSLVTDNLLFSTVYNFSRGFLDNPEYILITAG